jgi:hypothetical protein
MSFKVHIGTFGVAQHRVTWQTPGQRGYYALASELMSGCS